MPDSREAYEAMGHLALNVRRPSTEWLNMGYWSSGNDINFPDACESLAHLLHEAAGIPINARILDVGHGCGDSLILLARRSPSVLHGVTSIPFHAERARKRSSAQVWCDDATTWIADHVPSATYNTILALDCAYHMAPRHAFFENAHCALLPGGTLALVDLVGAWPYPAWAESPLPPPTQKPSLMSRVMHYIVCWIAGISPEAFVCMDEYKAQLETVGFKDTRICDISHDVFPGFSRFLCTLGCENGQPWCGSTLSLHAYHSFGRVVSRWAAGENQGLVRCVLVTARKSIDDI